MLIKAPSHIHLRGHRPKGLAKPVSPGKPPEQKIAAPGKQHEYDIERGMTDPQQTHSLLFDKEEY